MGLDRRIMLTKPMGDANIFLNSIGRQHPDTRILDAAAIVATGFIITETNYDERIEYWEFFKRGVCFVFCDAAQLTTVFIYAQALKRYQAYPFLRELVKGLDYGSSKSDIMRLLGSPSTYGQHYIKYYLGKKYIHFEFDNNETLRLITISQD